MTLEETITEYPGRRWGVWVLTPKGAKGSFDLRGKKEKEPLTRSLSLGWLPGDVTDVVASGSVSEGTCAVTLHDGSKDSETVVTWGFAKNACNLPAIRQCFVDCWWGHRTKEPFAQKAAVEGRTDKCRGFMVGMSFHA